MTPRTLSDWALMAAAFGLLAFILISPTGSFVQKPAHAGISQSLPGIAKSLPPGPMAGLSPAPQE